MVGVSPPSDRGLPEVGHLFMALPQQIGHSLSPEDQTTLLWTTSQNKAGMQYSWGQSVSERKKSFRATQKVQAEGWS